MSKVSAPLFSLTASRTLANTLTFQKRASTHVVYLKSKPGDKTPFTPSASQLTQRVTFGALVASWQALNDNEKGLWEEEAKLKKFNGTGYGYFMHVGGGFLGYDWGASQVEWSDPLVSWVGL